MRTPVKNRISALRSLFSLPEGNRGLGCLGYCNTMLMAGPVGRLHQKEELRMRSMCGHIRVRKVNSLCTGALNAAARRLSVTRMCVFAHRAELQAKSTPCGVMATLHKRGKSLVHV